MWWINHTLKYGNYLDSYGPRQHSVYWRAQYIRIHSRLMKCVTELFCYFLWRNLYLRSQADSIKRFKNIPGTEQADQWTTPRWVRTLHDHLQGTIGTKGTEKSPTVHSSYSRMESAACAWEFLEAYSYEGLREHLFQCFAILQPKVHPMCNLNLFHCNLESL